MEIYIWTNYNRCFCHNWLILGGDLLYKLNQILIPTDSFKLGSSSLQAQTEVDTPKIMSDRPAHLFSPFEIWNDGPITQIPLFIGCTLLRICRAEACAPLPLSLAPWASSRGHPPDFWSASHSLLEFWRSRSQFSGGHHFWFGSCWISWSGPAIPSNKLFGFWFGCIFLNVPPSFSNTCSCPYAASRHWRRFSCGFWSWRKRRSFQSNLLFFEPESFMSYFSVKDAICLKLFTTLVVQALVVLGRLLNKLWTFDFILALEDFACESRWGRAYLNNLTDLSAQSSTNLHSSLTKYSFVVIDSAILCASEGDDSISEGRTDIFLNLRIKCSINFSKN